MDVIDIPMIFDDKLSCFLIDPERVPKTLNDALRCHARYRGIDPTWDWTIETHLDITGAYREARAAQAAGTDGSAFVHEIRLATGTLLRLGDVRSLQEGRVMSAEAVEPPIVG